MRYTTSDRSAVSPDNGSISYPLDHPEVRLFLDAGGEIGEPLIEIRDDLEYIREVERAEIVNEALDLLKRRVDPPPVPLPPNPEEGDPAPETPPLDHPDEADERDDLLVAERARADAAEAKVAELSRQLEQARAEAPVQLPPNPAEARLSDYGTVGDEADLNPDHLLDFMRKDQSADLGDTGDIIAKLSSAKRKRFTELLNVELAELQQMRGAAGENLTRETEIEKLLGLFARVGEM